MFRLVPPNTHIHATSSRRAWSYNPILRGSTSQHRLHNPILHCFPSSTVTAQWPSLLLMSLFLMSGTHTATPTHRLALSCHFIFMSPLSQSPLPVYSLPSLSLSSLSSARFIAALTRLYTIIYEQRRQRDCIIYVLLCTPMSHGYIFCRHTVEGLSTPRSGRERTGTRLRRVSPVGRAGHGIAWIKFPPK